MKLRMPFVQLPMRVDADRLAEEVSGFGPKDWRAHPQGYVGNSALPLISVEGDPDREGLVGPMRPTQYLLRCPYLVQILATLGAVWGRVRLMRLAAQAEVEPHVDMDYYWHERVRVHIPIVTRPQVRFLCGEAEVNMAPGECWIFDTWRLHRVINAGDQPRIHLVADTIGSERFWQLVNVGRVPGGREIPGWAARLIESALASSQPVSTEDLRLESTNSPLVMTPWEARQHVGFLMSEAESHPGVLSLLAGTGCVKERDRQRMSRFPALWRH
jgi:hypothetical protein